MKGVQEESLRSCVALWAKLVDGYRRDFVGRVTAIIKSLQAQLFFALSAVVLLAVGTLGYLSFTNSRAALEAKVEDQLTSVADLKEEQIISWLADRRADATLLADNKLNQEHFTELLSAEVPEDRKREFAVFLTDNLIGLQQSRTGYLSIVMADRSGRVVISTDQDLVGSSVAESPAFQGALRSGQGQFTRDITRSPMGDTTMAFSHVLHEVDINTHRELPFVNGVVILTVEMESTIFPLIRAWPGMGRTGETLLVRAEGDQTLFLNNLRFAEDASLNLRLNSDSPHAQPAHRGSRGQEGLISTTDYRGVPVLAAYRHIPDPGWGFVAKEDLDEARRPVRVLNGRLILAAVLVLLGAALLSVWISRTMTRPVASLMKATDSVAEGDLTPDIDIDRDDEIGVLAESFRRMVSALRQHERQREVSQEAARSILTTLDLREVLREIGHSVIELTDATYATIAVGDSKEITEMILVGLRNSDRSELRGFSAAMVECLMDRSTPLRAGDITEFACSVGADPPRAELRSFLGVCIQGREAVQGAMFVAGKQGQEEFSKFDEQVLEDLASHAAVAIENARLFEAVEQRAADLAESYDHTLDALVAALDARDKETEGHSQRVVGFTLALAESFDLTEQELNTLRRGALLHDIGKIGVPDAILHKPGSLDEAEWEIVKHHPEWGKQILEGIPFLEEASRIVYAHQEWWDGSGYPRGLKGEEIPLGARIFAVADAFDAITSDRPYRQAQGYAAARDEIQKGSGTQFDPAVVAAFLATPKSRWDAIRHAAASVPLDDVLPDLTDVSSDQTLQDALGILSKTLAAVGSSLDLDEVMHKTMDVVIDRLGAAASALLLYDPSTDSLSLAAEAGLPEELQEELAKVPVPGFHSEAVVREGEPRLYRRLTDVPLFRSVGLKELRPELDEYLCIPLSANGRINGLMGVFSRVGDKFVEEDLQLSRAVGEQIGLAIENARVHESVKYLAVTDGLTGAYNRRYLDRFLEQEVRRCSGEGESLSLVMIDIDNFKRYNDRYGHMAGDEVLREFPSRIRHGLRNSDVVARYGGDEFVIVLPDTGEKGAQFVAKKIVRSTESLESAHERVDVSLGVLHCTPDALAGAQPEDLLSYVDRALYESKAAGHSEPVVASLAESLEAAGNGVKSS